jgi:FkbM family methyltransferase
MNNSAASIEFAKYAFYDCDLFGLFTNREERFQPSAYGKRLHSPRAFFAERASRPFDSAKIRLWRELGKVLEVVGSEGTVLDVGGYIGTFCIPLALSANAAGLNMRFHSFEPGPTSQLLAINVAANSLGDTVSVHESAVSNYNGYTIYRFTAGGSIGGAVFGTARDDASERIVPCCTIDAFCADKPGRMFIKLDTQGHEADIMHSSLEVISQKRAIWQIEFIAWVARREYEGRSFSDFLLDQFHLFEGRRPILPAMMADFLNEIDARPSRMADLLLVPKEADFVQPLLQHLQSGA